MKLTAATIEQLAVRLDTAEVEARAIAKITDEFPELDWEDAYAIQNQLRALKQQLGVKITGRKMGFTSRAKMQQMGVSDPIHGFLTDYGCIPDGGTLETAGLIHPKVEAEIAFVTKRPLRGPGCHIGAVLAATDFILPALEVIDSRYENFRFDLTSVIADNTSAARYVLGGSCHDATALDLKNLGVVLEKNGEIVSTAAASAVLGHPALSVAMLANLLGKQGKDIPAGTLILTGGITEAVRVEAGDNVRARYQHIGSLSLRVA